MNQLEVFEFNPEMQGPSRRIFTLYRIVMMGGLLIAILAAAVLAG